MSVRTQGSSIRQVAVHLSDYGKERLAEEARSGPQVSAMSSYVSLQPFLMFRDDFESD